MAKAKRVGCHWFRKDLRLHDNPALCESLTNTDEFYAIYILSPLFNKSIVSQKKKNFLLQSLKELDENLQKLGSKLIVIQGNLLQVFRFIIKHFGITKVTFETACDRYGRQNEKVVEHLANQSGIHVTSFASHTLFDVDKVVQACGEKIPVLFDEYLEVVEQLQTPCKPYPKVCKTPGYNIEKVFDKSLTDQMYQLNDVQMSGELVGGEYNGLVKLEEYLEQVILLIDELSLRKKNKLTKLEHARKTFFGGRGVDK